MRKSDNTTARAYSRLQLEIAVAVVFTFTMLIVNGEGQSQDDFCSQTARVLFSACKSEIKDDAFKKEAICINISDKELRKECFKELEEALEDGNQLCRQQRNGRLDACRVIGEARYDPEINPAMFDNNFTALTKPNPYFPLKIGNRWEFGGGDEVNIVEVLNETKLIAGVTCIVVNDQVFKNGDLVEDTDDWFAQAKDGNVWYFGEEVKDFESFDGDNPRKPELVKIDGSFKFGRDGDKGGIFFFASPRQGVVHYEEFSLGNAEDVTEILSTTYKFGSNADLDRLVPRQLVERFCPAGDCVATKNYSLLEPGVSARKYYAREIGFFLEVNLDTQEVLQLVNCNFDSRCVNLPRQ